MTSTNTTPVCAQGADPAPLRAVHTTNFPGLLRRLGASLLVTTYQAGKLVIVRDDGDHLNTHFRSFQAPMGLAFDGNRLAVGTSLQVWEFADLPAVTAKLDPPGRHDACFLPRASHVTGNIQGHEMAWGPGGELWVVNTRFSCLCTLDTSASFAPRWRPPFVSARLGAERPRCRPNGLGMVDGRPRLRHGWGDRRARRLAGEGKAKGGIVMDVDCGEVIARGLSMPHSPRWYAGRLWVCRSGAPGRSGISTRAQGNTSRSPRCPASRVGWTSPATWRSSVSPRCREPHLRSASRSPSGLSDRADLQRVCVVDLASGQVVAILRFDTTVQEIFAVTVLPGRRWPELINDNEMLLENSFVVPDAALADVPPALRAPAVPFPAAKVDRKWTEPGERLCG